LLLPLVHVLARDPEAGVVVLPSDHYVRDEGPFRDSVTRARALAEMTRSVALIGVSPDRPESDYGWIVTSPEQDASRGARVERFEEKPAAAQAEQLFRAGALWNSFVLVGSAAQLWQLAREHLPEQAALLESHAGSLDQESPAARLWQSYEQMRPADFSRRVLHHAQGLWAVKLEPCGWSDWGTADRELESLRGSTHLDRLVRRINGSTSIALHPPRRGSTTREGDEER
ncbi:MAG TPA: sugar phosphate nucleotidyltransferase, partial [Polyangiaceae bacterium]|nr:sugar phosphate nucleotidyltransferase [Polyangiaceae bacterium]